MPIGTAFAVDIDGTDGDDLIDGSWNPVPPGPDSDKINGKEGDDIIFGLGGDDEFQFIGALETDKSWVSI